MMNTEVIQVRLGRGEDRDCILAVHRDAFGDDEGPEIVSLVEEMLDDPAAEPIYSFVTESKKIHPTKIAASRVILVTSTLTWGSEPTVTARSRTVFFNPSS